MTSGDVALLIIEILGGVVIGGGIVIGLVMWWVSSMWADK